MSADMNASEFPRQALPTLGNPTRELANRLVWKEFRELLPTVIVLLATALFCFYVAGLCSRSSNGTIFSGLRICLHVAWLAFAAIIGITQFATESDQGTIGRLQCLPVQPRLIGWGKILPGLVVTLIGTLLIRLLFSVSLRAAGVSIGSNELMIPLLVAIAVSLATYCLGAWSAVAVGSLTRAFFSTWVLFLAVCWFHSYEDVTLGWVNDHSLVTTLLMLGFASLTTWSMLAGVQAWVEGRPWLSERLATFRTKKRADDSLKTTHHVASKDVSLTDRANFWPSYGRTVWLSWRQSRRTLAIVTGLCLLSLALPVAVIWFGEYIDPRNHFIMHATGILSWASIFCVMVLSSASGSLFWPDHQRGNMRFFQQQRETPIAFWLGKLTPWLMATILLSVVFFFVSNLVLALDANGISNRGLLLFPYLLLLPLVWMLIAWASGQLCSVFIPNPLISGLTAMVLAAFNYAWLCYLVAFQDSYVWFMTPILVSFFVASWWRCRDWLAGRNRWFEYAAPLALCASVISITFASLVYHRANAIPDTPSDYISLLSYALPDVPAPKEYEQTAELYREAIEMLNGENSYLNRNYSVYGAVRSDDKTIAFEKKYKAAIEKIIEASKRTYCDSILDFQSVYNDGNLSESERASLLNEGGKAQSNVQYAINCRIANSISRGELDSALEALFAWDRLNQRSGMPIGHDTLFFNRLIDWADLPGQTPELIRDAIGRLEGEELDLQPLSSQKTWEARSLYRRLVQQHAFRNRRIEGQLFRTQIEMLDPREKYLGAVPLGCHPKKANCKSE